MSRGNRRADFRELNRPQRAQHQEQSENKSCVTDAVDDKCFLPRVRRRFSQEIKTDQEIAAQPDAFPADEQKKQVVRGDEREHREHKQIQVAEEAVVTAFMRHVARGIHMDQESHARDNEQHHARQRVNQDAPRHVEPHHFAGIGVHDTGGNPVKQVVADHAFRDRP